MLSDATLSNDAILQRNMPGPNFGRRRVRWAECLTAVLLVLGRPAQAEPPEEGNVLGASDLTPMVAQTLTPLLGEWIVQSRDAAIAQGVHAVPAAVRSALGGYVPEATLERTRWRLGGSGEMTLQEQLFRFNYSPAVTLDYVIVFQNEADVSDPKLWVHELRHVMQFAEWGVPEFAARYVQDYEAVEKEAAEYRWEWMKLAGLIPKVPAAQPAAD